MVNVLVGIGLAIGLMLIGYMIVSTYFAIINISDSLRMIARTLDKTLGGNKLA